MQNSTERAFEYSFVTDCNGSYLVLFFDGGIKLIEHQAEIIGQNPSSVFIPFNIRRENERVSIYYNITSKIMLSQYLERKQLSRKELLDLLRGITRGLMLYSNYLLDLSGFIVDKDFIYINPATAEVSLVYVPAPGVFDAVGAYKNFLKDLIVNSASVDDNAKDNYLQRLLSYLKAEAFGLTDFDRLISELRSNGGSNTPASHYGQEYIEMTGEAEAAAASPPASNGSSLAEFMGKAPVSKNLTGIILLQLLIILAAAIVMLFLASRALMDMSSALGILIIAAALDVIAVKRISRKQESHMKKGDTGLNKVRQKPIQKAPKGENVSANKTPGVMRVYDTTLISEAESDGFPYLESVGAHIGERVIVGKDKFVIGRLDSMVDYIVPASTVGKLHAEITTRDGAYFIKDLNSKNGTYINDVRIPSNKEHEIRFNDRIRFSNFEYIFKQQKLE
ncbi:MAG TPA: DUF6382 domain-containing protein [Candidatus Nitrosocosmicus sp.]|nr:DUF6382 domain-containing protein [Candidatus Nitrosocosmicus sp.]